VGNVQRKTPANEYFQSDIETLQLFAQRPQVREKTPKKPKLREKLRTKIQVDGFTGFAECGEDVVTKGWKFAGRSVEELSGGATRRARRRQGKEGW